MPSALEKMVKILRLEREQGGKNTAVVGGLSAYASNWQPQAREQARRPQHHILIDEIADELAAYESIDGEGRRIQKLNYLLDRITNRKPAPQAYRDRLANWEEKLKALDDAAGKSGRRGPQSAHSGRRAGRQDRGGSRKNFQAYDSASWDEDFTGGPRQHHLDIPAMPSLSRPPRAPRPERSQEEQLAIMRELAGPTSTIKGIGKKFSELLQLMDLHSVKDLLFNFPREYRDYTALKCIKDLEGEETTTVIARVDRYHVAAGSGGGKDLVVLVSDESGLLSVRFFRQHFLATRLRRGMLIMLHGKVRFFRDMAQMANPEWEELDLGNLRQIGIVPIYRLTKGLRARHLRRTMKALAKEWAAKIPDPIPQSVLDRNDLADLGWAIQQRHFPDGWDHLEHAQRRLKFDNLLMLQLALLGKRREWQAVAGPALSCDDEFLSSFIEQAFPFALTASQKRAIEDIRGDITQPVPMNRLLQGDVGSGKTAVAIIALGIALANGRQAALMAPTGVLAEQHFGSLNAALARAPATDKPVIALLTGALTASERESIYRGMADGSIDIVVGTHALIQEGVEFHDLAVAVIDEQQRFGVDQRAALRGKAHNPHVLVMTATPFPRTLALTAYADLDLTTIDEKPPGRQKIVSKIIDPVARERLNGYVIAQLEQGRQAFFVQPLVDESDSIETASATEAHERLSQVFFRFRVGLLHGRMSPGEKNELMADFAAQKYDVMVTTAIAEVGVDMPNASVIVIDGANRFGLAQLHQFRGRVGRGAHQSYCFLIPDSSADISLDRIRACQAGELAADALNTAEKRLSAMEESDDGFFLAERDMELRGAGELLGRRQSGVSDLQLLEMTSPELIETARREAQTLYEEDPDLRLADHQLLAEYISQVFADSGDIS